MKQVIRSRTRSGPRGLSTSERFTSDASGGGAPSFDYRLHHARYALAGRHVRDRVLDVACGTGYGSRALFDRHCSLVVGVDVDARAVSWAASHYAPGPHFVRADALRLPFQDHRFSGVVSFETIEHLADPKRFLQELDRVTARGATLVFSTPNYHGGKYATPFHVREFRHHEFQDLLAEVFGSDIEWMGQLDAGAKVARLRSLLRTLIRAAVLLDPFNLRRFIFPEEFCKSVTAYSLGITSTPGEIFAWRPTALYQIAVVKKPG